MIQGQWSTIDAILGAMNDAEKRALVARIEATLPAQDSEAALQSQRRTLDELRTSISALPVVNPADGFQSSDHDRILYGKLS